MQGLERDNTFYQLWAKKEALQEATGKGLNGLTKDVTAISGRELVRLGKTWLFQDIEAGEGHAGALAAERKGRRA